MAKIRKLPLTKTEERKYLMLTERDYEILGKIKELERMKLTKEEKSFVKFTRTQLEKNWRKPLIEALDKILKKHNKTI